MDLQQLITKIKNYEFSLILMILKIFRTKVSQDLDKLQIWSCSIHDLPFFVYEPFNWIPPRNLAHITNACGCWRGNIYFDCKVKELCKENFSFVEIEGKLIDYYYCFITRKFVKAPREIELLIDFLLKFNF